MPGERKTVGAWKNDLSDAQTNMVQSVSHMSEAALFGQ